MLLLLLALTLTGAAEIPAAGQSSVLDVPYLPQTEALCGGAAAAMIFRYWGERHADVQQFESIVDWRAGGIATDVLVEAIRARGWKAEESRGNIETLRAQFEARRPLILLLEDRPGRYHYVVAVGADESHVSLHDPTWGPARRLTVPAFLRRWEAADFWTLAIARPDAPALSAAERPAPAPPTPPAPITQPTVCDRLLDEALDEIGANGLTSADGLLEAVRKQCPEASGPIRELAGVRFSQSRWDAAASLARQALRRDASDAYAWDVLGSSLFMMNDLPGALEAWNHVGKPQLDSVVIKGLVRTRYALVARALALTPNTLLTGNALGLAERRLSELPGLAAARIGYSPEADGFATVDIHVVEARGAPGSALEWTAVVVRTGVDREVSATIPGGLGQGEVWDVRWRWWEQRPSVAMGFAAPRPGRLGGVWRVDASWEAQTYLTDLARTETREERIHAALTAANWATPDFRYEVSGGIGSWNSRRRAVALGGAIEQRLLGDRVSIGAAADRWFPITNGAGFSTGSLHAWFRSSRDARGLVALARGQVDLASRNAPLSAWSGAGDGRARPGLARAHRLLNDGIVSGPMFGRQVMYANIEGQRWLARPALLPVAVAIFADVAKAGHRLPSASKKALQIDAGMGLRVRLPGRDGTLRMDYARGLRDGTHAVTVGWTL